MLVKPACSDLWCSQTYLLFIFTEIPGLRGYTQGTIYIGEKREINVSWLKKEVKVFSLN